MPCRSSNQSLTGLLAPQKPLYGQGATSEVREGGEGRDPSSLCGICKSLLDTVSSLGLSSTRKVLSDRYKCSGGHGVKTKRQEKGLRGLGLFSLEKSRKWEMRVVAAAGGTERQSQTPLGPRRGEK